VLDFLCPDRTESPYVPHHLSSAHNVIRYGVGLLKRDLVFGDNAISVDELSIHRT
jgi:hypothetical protein